MVVDKVPLYLGEAGSATAREMSIHVSFIDRLDTLVRSYPCKFCFRFIRAKPKLTDCAQTGPRMYVLLHRSHPARLILLQVFLRPDLTDVVSPTYPFRP